MAPSSTKSPKKRKHASFKETTTPIKVEVTPIDPSHDPVVVSFPRGVPPSILSHDKSSNSNTSLLPHFTLSKLKSSSDRGRRITGSDDTCTYTATSSGRGHDGRLTKLYVAVLNKTTKTLKLIPTAERGNTFALDQTVKAYKPNVSSESMAIGGLNDSKVSASDRVNMLVESFGSKKKQKVMASRAANVVNINKVVGAGNVMMDSVVGQKGVVSEENRKMLMDGSKAVNTVEAALLEARRQLLPPFDENADTPSKVYNPELMAETNAWGQISRIVDKVIKNAEQAGDISDWINKLLGKGKPKTFIPDSINELLQPLDPFNKKGHVFRVKTVFFLFLMMRFHYMIKGRKKITGGDTAECIQQTKTPNEVGTRLLELFMTPIESGEETGYMCTARNFDKLYSYMFILFIIASGNDMKASSVNQLCKDLKIDERRAMMIYREAGFTVKKGSKGDIGVSLSLPLTFPPPKRGKK